MVRESVIAYLTFNIFIVITRTLSFILISSLFNVYGQYIEKQIVSANGASYSIGNIYFDFNTGALVNNTYTYDSLIITNGFFQNNPMYKLSSIEDILIEEIKVYPIPSSEIINFKNIPDDISLKYSIFNIDGKLIREDLLENNLSLQISDLSSGIYVIKLKGIKNNKEYVAKFQKQ